MRQSTIQNFTNPRPAYNTPQFAAWAVGVQVIKPGFHNLRFGFVPPKLQGVVLWPNDPDAKDEDDAFDPGMFDKGGLLYETPMNHFIRLMPFGDKTPFYINAAYLSYYFMAGPKFGYRELARLLRERNKYEEGTTIRDAAGKATGTFQASGTEDRE